MSWIERVCDCCTSSSVVSLQLEFSLITYMKDTIFNAYSLSFGVIVVESSIFYTVKLLNVPFYTAKRTLDNFYFASHDLF